MNRKLIAAIVLLLALLAPITYLTATAHSYEKFRMTGEPGEQACEQYYEACTCYGSLAVMESYPPQYACDGYERCEPLNRTVCN